MCSCGSKEYTRENSSCYCSKCFKSVALKDIKDLDVTIKVVKTNDKKVYTKEQRERRRELDRIRWHKRYTKKGWRKPNHITISVLKRMLQEKIKDNSLTIEYVINLLDLDNY